MSFDGGFYGLVRKGELLILTSGSYSDYNVLYLAKALRDFDTEKVMKVFLELCKCANRSYSEYSLTSYL